MMQTDANTILCMTREEYAGVIKETKENLCFETAVTDADTIRKECEKLLPWFVDPRDVYGVVYFG